MALARAQVADNLADAMGRLSKVVYSDILASCPTPRTSDITVLSFKSILNAP